MPMLCGGGGGMVAEYTAERQRPLSLRNGGRSLMAGMDMVLAAQVGMVAG